MLVATDKYKILENILLVFQITTLLVGITYGGRGGWNASILNETKVKKRDLPQFNFNSFNWRSAFLNLLR